MSESEKAVAQNTRQQLSLKNLYLDPNNYRFIDSEIYTKVAGAQIFADDVQRRTNGLIVGRNGENIRDLIDSFRKNGFLPVDQIQVRRSGDSGKFLVVEGNRRVATLKWFQAQFEAAAIDLGRLDQGIFSRVPVVYYTDEDDAHHLVLMGLKHISGNKKWPAINQAELIRTLHDTHQMPVVDINQSIGISQQEVLATLQTMAIIDAYKASEFGEQFESEKYSIFREIIRNRDIRAWLAWDKDQKRADNQVNLDRLFSWISEETTLDEENDDEKIGNGQKLEPVLFKSVQIRELAKIINDEQALSNLDTTRNLAEATLASDVLGKDKVKNALSIIGQQVNAIFNNAKLIADSDRADILMLEAKLRSLMTFSQTQSLSAAARVNHLDGQAASRFSQLVVHEFRHFRGITLDGLSRINLIAGINNAGKTTLLEAIKLLCSLSDTHEFLDLVRRRAKTGAEQVNMEWFLAQIPDCNLAATYNGKPLALQLSAETMAMEDMTYYLKTVCFDASWDSEKYAAQVHFFEKYPQRTEGKIISICPAVFSSPFSSMEPELLRESHSKSLKDGSKEAIITFIRENIDADIRNIEQDDHGHFTVDHARIKPNPDLTQFGEGLQRIFSIGLLFAAAKNGVLIIDEFENAIHASLLGKAADFLYQFACKFHVQVFISSHSKECIDAFATSGSIPPDEISAYALVKAGGALKCHHFSGSRLHDLVQSVDFDLRGKGAR